MLANPEQEEAVSTEANAVMLVAPPGCGKTETLAMRAVELVRRGAIRPHRRLLAVTFTKRARDNMSVRIRSALGRESFSHNVTVANVHGLAARVVSAHRATIGLPQDLKMPTRSSLNRAVAGLGLSGAQRAAVAEVLQSANRSCCTDEELLAIVEESGNDAAIAVERARVASGELFFPDLIRHALRAMRVPQVASLYAEHFDAILVDEFQDLSAQQFEILQRAGVRNLMYAGDPLQGIFTWAGAEPEVVTANLEEMCDATIRLRLSYRSSPGVLGVVNAVSSLLEAPPLVAAEPAAWDPDDTSVVAVYRDEIDEAQQVVGWLNERVGAHPDESIGVIARSAFRRKELDRAIATSNLDAQFWDFAINTPGVLALLRRGARHIDPTLTTDAALEALLVACMRNLDPDDHDSRDAVVTAVEQLEDHLQPGRTLLDVLATFRDLSVDEGIPGGVHVLNAHQAKGHQFDRVVVVGLEDGHVPDFRSPRDPEELRVLLVMLSRARRELLVTRVQRRLTQYGTYKSQVESPWWTAIAAATSVDAAEQATGVVRTR